MSSVRETTSSHTEAWAKLKMISHSSEVSKPGVAGLVPVPSTMKKKMMLKASTAMKSVPTMYRGLCPAAGSLARSSLPRGRMLLLSAQTNEASIASTSRT